MGKKGIRKQLINLTDQYIQEANPPFTLKEILNTTELVPIISTEDELIGVFGFSERRTKQFGTVAIVNLAYIIPEYRSSLKDLHKYCAEYLSALNYEVIEITAKPSVSNWYKKLGNEPTVCSHIWETKKLLEVMS